jgi:hypothetical protein
VALGQKAICSGLGDQPFQVADPSMVSYSNSMVAIDERPSH